MITVKLAAKLIRVTRTSRVVSLPHQGGGQLRERERERERERRGGGEGRGVGRFRGVGVIEGMRQHERLTPDTPAWTPYWVVLVER